MDWRKRLDAEISAQGREYKELSLAAGLGETYVRDAIKRGRGKQEHLITVAGLLGKPADWLFPERTPATSRPVADVTLPDPGQEQTVELPPIGNRDVPVLGIAVAGDDADFTMNGEVVDRAPRPAGLANTRNVFALYVPTDSMYPAFRSGEIFFVNPNRQPSIGDDVVIELWPEDHEPAGKGFLKRLKARTPTKFIVEQFNPPRELEFSRDQVKAIHRVVPWQEAMGL